MSLVAVSLARGVWASTGVPVHFLPQAYTRALTAAQIIPILIPSTLDEIALQAIYERVDGIILSGGGDINPQCFETSHPEYSNLIDDSRDQTELKLVEWARAEDKPLLGICRGHQVLNVALGGSLLTDIPALHGDSVRHQVTMNSEWRDQYLHSVELAEGSRLAQIVGSGEIQVNSIHHQAIDQLGAGLKITACAPDGIIEAVEIPEARFCMSVQWHPEEIAPFDLAAQALFRAFADSMR